MWTFKLWLVLEELTGFMAKIYKITQRMSGRLSQRRTTRKETGPVSFQVGCSIGGCICSMIVTAENFQSQCQSIATSIWTLTFYMMILASRPLPPCDSTLSQDLEEFHVCQGMGKDEGEFTCCVTSSAPKASTCTHISLLKVTELCYLTEAKGRLGAEILGSSCSLCHSVQYIGI